ncbi:MAG: energy transducer TonB [Sphingobacteriia bacterium]|nr:energy transducer TonB [Sphingobacteriia bacterium]
MVMENKKEKKFINLPKYPGGKTAFQEFIRKNLHYPAEALEQRIEGEVYLKYRVNGLGKVVDVRVIHGLGHGCDEEAIRVIWLLKYEKAKNRGLRVTATMRTKINFKLPPAGSLTINYVTKPKTSTPAKTETPKSGGQTYGYTITIG